MKKMKPIIQILIGSISIFLLWLAGAFSYEYTFMSFGVEINPIFDFLPTIVVIALPFLLSIYAFVGKRNGLKALYFSALISVWLPIFAFILSHIFNDDGNILCWIYGFTLGIVLHPFHRLAWSTFDGVWLGDFGFDPDLCAGFLVVAIILSFIIYKFAKTKIKAGVLTEAVPNDNNQGCDF